MKIHEQFDDVSEYLEVIVCDNCSNDDTEKVVNNFKKKGLPIKYYTNSMNIGFDLNIEKCYEVSSGDYICTIGDDDFFKIGSLKFIINLIQEYDFGVIYMEGDFITSSLVLSGQVKFEVYENSMDFLKKITHNASFISALVVKRDLLKKIDFQLYVGTQLAHFPYVIDTILDNQFNCHIKTKFFNYQDSNSAFDIYEVFTKNISFILEKYPKKISTIIRNQLILDLGNSIIILRRKSKCYFLKEEFFKLKKSFGKFILFRIYIIPVFILPKQFLKIYRYIFLNIYKYSVKN
jgi:glycosyltransferase involved in cell wall biosynthesis